MLHLYWFWYFFIGNANILFSNKHNLSVLFVMWHSCVWSFHHLQGLGPDTCSFSICVPFPLVSPSLYRFSKIPFSLWIIIINSLLDMIFFHSFSMLMPFISAVQNFVCNSFLISSLLFWSQSVTPAADMGKCFSVGSNLLWFSVLVQTSNSNEKNRSFHCLIHFRCPCKYYLSRLYFLCHLLAGI